MFKTFNQKFVYNYPLIWNTKIVLFLLISVVIHSLFFAVGYQNAIVASVQYQNFYSQESNATTINLFAVLISVLVLIIWCVMYFRNNGFKAFYPKKNYALFQEFLLILVFCLSTFSYALSAIFGANVATRNAMPRELAYQRCETISKASMFLQGSFKESNYQNREVKGQIVRVQCDSFVFQGKNYALNSLINKNIQSFPFFDSTKDSLNRLQIQRWMNGNKKSEIAKIFKDYFIITNEHQLKSNISAEKWINLVYDYPEFTHYKVVGNSERELQYEYETAEAVLQTDSVINTLEFRTDTVSTTIKNVDGQSYVYPKYYVSQKSLEKYYFIVASSWQNALLDLDLIMIVLYLSFGGALGVFSFKVTSGRYWLIALIALGVVQIIFGIGTAFFSYNMTFPILYLIYFSSIFIYFIGIYIKKRGKKLSAILLNQILWLSLGFMPMIYVIVMNFVKNYSGYDNRHNLKTGLIVEKFPRIEWLEDNVLLLFQINLIFIVFSLYFGSAVIKKWRGISEE